MRWQLVGLIFCGALLVWLIATGPASREEAAPGQDGSAVPTADEAAGHEDTIQIEGIDWAALGTWARDNVALKRQDGEWAGVDKLVAGLGAFIHEASGASKNDTIEPRHVQALSKVFGAWGKSETNWPELVLHVLLGASEDPETWGRLVRALGPGLTAGLYEFAQDRRPRLVEELQRVKRDIPSAKGKARDKLEKEREDLQRLLDAIDRMQKPSEIARTSWDQIKRAAESSGKDAERAPK